MKGFLLALQSEFYKNRRTLGFWSAILLPLTIVFLVSLGFFLKSSKLAAYPPKELWGQFAGIPMGIMGSFLLPMFAVFVAYSVNNIEHRSDTWKVLFTLPIAKWSIYSAKFIYAIVLVFICLALFFSLTIGFGNLLGTIQPQLHFAGYHMESMLGEVYAKLFLASLGILALQFVISLLWKDFLKPIGIGFVGVIIGGILVGNVRWEYAYMFPYSQPLQSIMGIGRKGKDFSVENFFTKEVLMSLLIAAVVFVLGYFIIKRKSIK